MSVHRSFATRNISLPAMSRCCGLMGAREAGVRSESMVWPCAVGCMLPMMRTLSAMVACGWAADWDEWSFRDMTYTGGMRRMRVASGTLL